MATIVATEANPITYPFSATPFEGAIVSDSCLVLGVQDGLIAEAWQHSPGYAMRLKPLALPISLPAGLHLLEFVPGEIDLILCDISSLCAHCGDYELLVPDDEQEISINSRALQRRGNAWAKIQAMESELAVLRQLAVGTTEQKISELSLGTPIGKKPLPISEFFGQIF